MKFTPLCLFNLLVWLCVSLVDAHGQVHNKFFGNYTASKNAQTDFETFYNQNFSFDNNGKVLIDNIFEGYFFMWRDSLFVFPYKGVLKFHVKNDTLRGLSNDVSNGKWNKTNVSVRQAKDRRVNEQEATQTAQLLHQFYLLWKQRENDENFLDKDDVRKKYSLQMDTLCKKKLVKACEECMELETNTPLSYYDYLYKSIHTPNPKTNAHIEELIRFVLSFNPAEGHHMNGFYMMSLKKLNEAKKEFDKATEHGNKNAIYTKLNIEIEERKEK